MTLAFKKQSRNVFFLPLAAIILCVLSCHLYSYAQEIEGEAKWPKFGLVFQQISDYQKTAKIFYFYCGRQKEAALLKKFNPDGIYFPNYNVVRTVRLFSDLRIGPDYDFIVNHHPDWLLRYKDGSLVLAGLGRFVGPRLDLANPAYVDYLIDWLTKHALSGQFKVADLGLDNAMFMYANKNWAKYDTNEAYQSAWEYFLRRLSEAFRPQHKIILNVGGSDLPTFARMIRWVDGVLMEDLCPPPHMPGFDPKKARQTLQDRWRKGKWCSENGKIWAVRYNTTVQALKISPLPPREDAYISVGEREIIISEARGTVIARLDLTSPSSNTLEKLAQTVAAYGFKTEILNPYQETATCGTLVPIACQEIAPAVVLKFKQPPSEAFLFGFAAALMVAGPHSYYILGDERHQEYFYPEMRLSLGKPLGPMSEIAPLVYKRNYEKYQVFLNLALEPYPLTSTHWLPPWRGLLVKTETNP